MRFYKRLFLRTVSGIAILVLIIMLIPNPTVYQQIGTSIHNTEETESMVNINHKNSMLSDVQSIVKTSVFTQKLKDMTAAEETKFKDIMFKDSVMSESASSMNKNLSLLYGKQRDMKDLLTIGIPTVSRSANSKGYLHETLDSLIENTSDGDKEEITVVIFVADFNNTWNLVTAKTIYNTYKNFCDSGFIHVVHAKSGVYPQFSKLKKTLNDPMPRVVWRSKQNIDFALLMLYCKNISIYYMQLEDDVISAKLFLKDIKKFILQTKPNWVCLEFSKLGFIGKLFRTNSIDKVANFLLTFFDLKPCDILLGSVRDLLGQKKPIHSKLSLFQHIGKISSLKNKMMPSIDKTFKELGSQVLNVMQVPRGDNPDAKIETNLKANTGYNSASAYTNSSSFFWATNPGVGKYYRISYNKPLNISQIIVSTGDRMKKTDILKAGSLKVGKTKNCNNLKEIAKFIEGQVDTLAQGVTFPPPGNIQCISIEITKPQKEWLIIDTVSVFIDKFKYAVALL